MNAARGGYWLVLWSCFAQCAHANAAPSEPRLTGIVVLENRRMALLELPVEISGRSVTIEKPILKEGEHDGAYNLIAIDEKGAKVALRKGTEEAVELKLDQAPGEELANRTINLTSAALEQ